MTSLAELYSAHMANYVGDNKAFAKRIAAYLENWKPEKVPAGEGGGDDGWVIAGEKRGDKRRQRRAKV